jgi:hypothetical protein
VINGDIAKALQNLKPNSEWTLIGDDYADLVWLSAGDAPTLAEIQAEIALLPAKEQAAAEQAAADKAGATAKLEALGLTADDLKALGL